MGCGAPGDWDGNGSIEANTKDRGGRRHDGAVCRARRMCKQHGIADLLAVRQQSASLLRRSEISDVAEPIGAAVRIVRVRLTDIARIGFVMLAAAMSLTVPGEARAKRWRHIAHHHVWSKHTKNALAAMPPQTTSLGSMRYYGGPKSPMWSDR